MQDAGDQRRRGVQELQVRLEVVIMRGRGRRGRPQNRVVVGEEGEDDAEEEAGGCCWWLEEGIVGVEVTGRTAHDEKGRERPVAESHVDSGVEGEGGRRR